MKGYDWRRHKEELLGIEHPEDKKKKKVIAAMIRKKDQEMMEEEEEMWERGFCIKCNILRTTTKECSCRGTILCS